jgi:hypothetical protein
MPLVAALIAAQLAASQPVSPAAPLSQTADDYRLVNPKAIELFEGDRQLMQWALAKYDSDHNGYLSIFEADDAAQQFKQIADGDGDGRVTPAEYRAARDFIAARYAGAMAEVSKR